jgi:hypothetical protein
MCTCVQTGATALHLAAQAGHWQVVDVLLRAGADVEARTTDTAWTPLHGACMGGHGEAAEVLLIAGADPNVETDVRAPVFSAPLAPHALPPIPRKVWLGVCLTGAASLPKSDSAMEMQRITLMLEKGASSCRRSAAHPCMRRRTEGMSCCALCCITTAATWAL